ncbi:MAG TPA: hypothetical protein VGR07_09265, partial [Thermoanaerobaculia bacterium]|nr:hypothetical protein [Thermoanaerobaculia bacterium]
MNLHPLLTTILPLAPLAAAAIAEAAIGARATGAPPPSGTPGAAAVEGAALRLLARFGEGQAERIRLGVRQVAERWWPEDGDAEELAAFCEESFLADPGELAVTFARLEERMEQIDGHLLEVRREVMTPLDTDTGPLSVLDRRLGDLDLGAHIEEDLFETKVAFLALLNFPVHTLAERLAQGTAWDREAWARSRMMDRFAVRVPAAVLMEVTRAFNAADRYIAEYNLRLDRVVTPDGRRPFPEGLRLISHWGLRDDLAARYAEPDGLPRQRLTQRIMERIVRQEIPAEVIDNPEVLWEPVENRTWSAAEEGAGLPGTGRPAEREPDTRYARLLAIFHAEQKLDPYSPTEPTFVARRFERDRQIPEAEVEALLISVLDAPEVRELGRLIARRLGRPLEPFDLWYPGFRSRGQHGEGELDARVRQRYPTIEAFATALPETLVALGFTPERAAWLAARIAVDPARGAGHALPALRREDRAHLRTRVPRGGMDYMGYNVALHELGHNVEQVFSLHGIDHWWLASVPNNACTEAFAFVYQGRDLELLGLAATGAEARRDHALATLWNTYEIGGVSLVDMRVWNWLYAHPEATPAELRQATLAIAREVWNRHFAPVFG